MTVTRDIAYGPLARQRLDLYAPDAAAKGTIVYLYGGSWTSGDRRLYRFLGSALTRHGYALVVPDFRLYPQAVFPAFVEDAAMATAWTVANMPAHGAPASPLFLMGHSSGAHSATLLALDASYLRAHGLEPERIAGVISLAGPLSFNPLEFDSTRPIFQSASDIARARPIKIVHNGSAPMLLLHGEPDTTVGAHNSRNFAEALNEAGGRARAIFYPNLGHIGVVSTFAWPLRWRASTLDDTVAFLDAIALGHGVTRRISPSSHRASTAPP